MTPLPLRTIRYSTTWRRVRAAFGALVLGTFAASLASPAAAACSGVQATLSPSAGVGYICQTNCRVVGSEDRLFRTYTYDAHDARLCMHACTSMSVCTAISVEFGWETRDGRTVPVMTCNIWIGSGELATADDPVGIPGRIRGPAMCVRDRSLWRDPRLQIDTRLLDQDRLRPSGVPGPSVPYSSKKP